jgi:hypothetical protein
MSRLVVRVAALERRARQAAGCPMCGGRSVYILESDESVPWLDAMSCCRACGSGVKVVYRDLWEQL